jgi:hypothetical protein
MQSQTIFPHSVTGHMATGDSDPKQRTFRLTPQALNRLKADGDLLIEAKQYNGVLDVHDHAAAQNAHGWVLNGGNYMPKGCSPSAILLLNVGFSIPEEKFEAMPEH